MHTSRRPLHLSHHHSDNVPQTQGQQQSQQVRCRQQGRTAAVEPQPGGVGGSRREEPSPPTRLPHPPWMEYFGRGIPRLAVRSMTMTTAAMIATMLFISSLVLFYLNLVQNLSNVFEFE
jgi:hypothetical protein